MAGAASQSERDSRRRSIALEGGGTEPSDRAESGPLGLTAHLRDPQREMRAKPDETDGGQRDEAAEVAADLARRLRAMRIELTLTPLACRTGSRPPARPGAFLHSTLGLALRRVACEEQRGCRSRCAQPGSCAVGRLIEKGRHDTPAPGAGPGDAPVRFVARAPWDWAPDREPTRADLVLLSPDPRDTRSLEAALESGPVRATASRFGIEVSANGEAEELAEVEPPPGDGPFAVRLSLESPVKLIAAGRVMEAFDATVFLRRLAWRVSAWAFFLQRLPWPPLWPALEPEVARIQVREAVTRFVSEGRWSARQRRRVPRQGLVGEAELADVGTATLLLLRLAERCGVGGGASEGLGQIRILEIDRGRGSA